MINFQNFNWKKIIMVIIFVLFVVVVGYLMYALFFKSPTPTPEQKTNTGEIGQLPGGTIGTPPGTVTPGDGGTGTVTPTEKITKITATTTSTPDIIAQGGITKITDLDFQKNSSFTLDSTGNNIVSYQKETGLFYKIMPDGTKEQLSERVYKDVENVAWAPGADKAILEFPDGSNILFDIKSDKQISLPKDWTEFDFNKPGDKIGFKDMNPNPDLQWIAMSNPDGSGQKYLEPLGTKAKQFEIDWSPSGDKVAQYNPGSSAATSRLLFVGLNGENYRDIDMRGYGVETKWTPDGSRILYSAHAVSTDHKPLLHIVNASGNTVGYDHQDIALNTWPDKCTFADADTVYCAVPKELPYGADLAPAVADNTPDYIYKVNLKNGAKSFVAEPEYDYTIDSMQISDDGSNLFFTDKQTGALHSIKLK
ncbi:MAG: hypothetical protein UT02_C0029G0005 [Parcubacteria group bacterium GW2011_GWC2_38_7]|nr:MAG: hypothetical protein UT02_C0029G0005 [Parcubacteria group bacterium GW2011_GWC2_38_7]